MSGFCGRSDTALRADVAHANPHCSIAHRRRGHVRGLTPDVLRDRHPSLAGPDPGSDPDFALCGWSDRAFQAGRRAREPALLRRTTVRRGYLGV
jgi:hypothetical protein